MLQFVGAADDDFASVAAQHQIRRHVQAVHSRCRVCRGRQHVIHDDDIHRRPRSHDVVDELPDLLVGGTFHVVLDVAGNAGEKAHHQPAYQRHVVYRVDDHAYVLTRFDDGVDVGGEGLLLLLIEDRQTFVLQGRLRTVLGGGELCGVDDPHGVVSSVPHDRTPQSVHRVQRALQGVYVRTQRLDHHERPGDAHGAVVLLEGGDHAGFEGIPDDPRDVHYPHALRFVRRQRRQALRGVKYRRQHAFGGARERRRCDAHTNQDIPALVVGEAGWAHDHATLEPTQQQIRTDVGVNVRGRTAERGGHLEVIVHEKHVDRRRRCQQPVDAHVQAAVVKPQYVEASVVHVARVAQCAPRARRVVQGPYHIVTRDLRGGLQYGRTLQSEDHLVLADLQRHFVTAGFRTPPHGGESHVVGRATARALEIPPTSVTVSHVMHQLGVVGACAVLDGDHQTTGPGGEQNGSVVILNF